MSRRSSIDVRKASLVSRRLSLPVSVRRLRTADTFGLSYLSAIMIPGTIAHLIMAIYYNEQY
jgi:hypothetical protein